MRQVITAARKSIPEMCEDIGAIKESIVAHSAMLSDFGMVSDASREVMRQACENDATAMVKAIGDFQEKLNEFAGLLSQYKRKFGGKKQAVEVDDLTAPLPFSDEIACRR